MDEWMNLERFQQEYGNTREGKLEALSRLFRAPEITVEIQIDNNES